MCTLDVNVKLYKNIKASNRNQILIRIPAMKRELFKHIFAETVRWGDCDMLGHVNNTVFLRYIESARIAYFQDIMKVELSVNSIEGWVIADLNCSFRAQLKFPSEIEICTRISRIGNSSATIDSVIFHDEEQNPVFTSTATIVWCNYEEGKSVRISDDCRAAICEHEGNEHL